MTTTENETVTLTKDEVKALNAYVMGDFFETKHIDSATKKFEELLDRLRENEDDG